MFIDQAAGGLKYASLVIELSDLVDSSRSGLGIVIDSSGSMDETLPTVQKVVMGFLRDLLRPTDRAFVGPVGERFDE